MTPREVSTTAQGVLAACRAEGTWYFYFWPEGGTLEQLGEFDTTYLGDQQVSVGITAHRYDDPNVNEPLPGFEGRFDIAFVSRDDSINSEMQCRISIDAKVSAVDGESI